MSRLLVVDDEAAIAWGIAELAATMGHAARTAASAEEGLRLAGESPPDLILLDVRLPGIDGLSAIEPALRTPRSSS
jgi:CheY-like chemotaxis protein